MISPASTKDRIGHYVGRADLGAGQELTLDIELSLPQGSKGGVVTIFAKPAKGTLEEEP
jgi:hypothetical protein